MHIEGLPTSELEVKEYFVAYFDLLGIKNEYRKNKDSVLSKIWLVNNRIKKLTYNKKCIVKSFSDNFLLAIECDKDNPEKSLNELLNMAGGFVNFCISIYNLLVRGAIVRGYIQNPKAMGDVKGVVGKNGYINVIKDFGLKEPYNGLSEIMVGDIAMDFAYYFTKSEQLPSAISLDVDVKGGVCKKSAGIIVQPMPNCTEDIIVILEDIVNQMKNIATIVEEKTIQGVIDFYFGHFPIKQLEDVNPKYVCSCSKDKVSQMLITLGKDELMKIVEEHGQIEVGCQFCNKKYKYSKEDIENFFN